MRAEKLIYLHGKRLKIVVFACKWIFCYARLPLDLLNGLSCFLSLPNIHSIRKSLLIKAIKFYDLIFHYFVVGSSTCAKKNHFSSSNGENFTQNFDHIVDERERKFLKLHFIKTQNEREFSSLNQNIFLSFSKIIIPHLQKKKM